MRVLVTGATGFIGTHVINELIKRDVEIIATSRSENRAKLKAWYSSVKFIEHDIQNTTGNLFSKFQNPDILIHLAWSGLPNYKNLFHIESELHKQYYFIKKMVTDGLNDLNITGTCFEYGMQQGCLSEDGNPPSAENSYALAKDCLRKFLLLLQQEHVFTFKWLRLFYMHGSGQNENSILSKLQSALDQNDSTFNMSGGQQVRDYLPIEEVARHIVTCSLQTKTQGIINISSNNPVKIVDLVNRYLIERNKTISLNLGFYPYPDYEPFSFWGDNTKLNNIYIQNESNRTI
jgi:dTDP-6-deoxy-L-talose 4-dehydrogenase (NAD+)